MNSKVFAASNICIAEKSNDLFLFVTMRLLSTRVNRNGDAVTAEFIDEIVTNQSVYEGLPVYVDLQRLLAGDLKGLGHMYNRMTGKFKTTQVGSLSNFTKVEDEYGISLLAEARFPKREAEVCEKIMELYENDALNFSFEISYIPDAVVKEDGVLYIQANEHNMLTGLAIVSVPAYEEAVALSLVAEDESSSEANVAIAAEREGVENMEVKNEQLNAEEAITEEAVVDETVADAVVTEEAVAEEAAAEEAKPEEAVAEEETVSEDTVAEAETENAVADFIAPVADAVDFALEVPPVLTPPEPAPDPAVVEDAQIEAAHAQIDAEVARLRSQIASLEAECEQLRAEHVELEAYRAQKRAEELANRQRLARGFAEKQGLDVESEEVSAAIASVDYEKLAELVMQNEAEETAEVSVAAFVPAMDVEEKSARERLFDTDM